MPRLLPAAAVFLTVRCPLCQGRGCSDPASIPGAIPCSSCATTGRVECSIDQLTPEQTTTLRDLMETTPPDGDREYAAESSRENTTRLLTGIRIELVDVDQNGSILLTTSLGLGFRISPALIRGKFHHLDVAVLPPSPGGT